MGPIQSGLNQSMSILGLMATQTAGFKNYQEQVQLRKDIENVHNAGASAIDETIKAMKVVKNASDEEAINRKVELVKDLVNQQKDNYTKLALKGDKEAFNKVTSPEYIKNEKKAQNFNFHNELENAYYRNMIKAQESLNNSQMEKRGSNVDLEHITDYRDKIWNYDIDYEPGLKETYSKVKNIVEKENK